MSDFYSLFPGYYKKTELTFVNGWDSVIIVMDANIILNFYRYSQKARDELFGFIRHENIENKLWLPFQVAKEFHENLYEVIREQENAYSFIKNEFANVLEAFGNQMANRFKNHAVIDVSDLKNKLNEFLQTLSKQMDEKQPQHPTSDSIRAIDDLLNKVFSQKIGPEPSEEKLKEYMDAGKERFQKHIPPGYKDIKNKDDIRQYGDVILWLETIDYCKENNIKNLILVTDDKKEDWWRIENGHTIGGRPELFLEILQKAGTELWIYNSHSFIQFLSRLTMKDLNKEVSDEIAEFSKRTDKDISHISRQFRKHRIKRVSSHLSKSVYEVLKLHINQIEDNIDFDLIDHYFRIKDAYSPNTDRELLLLEELYADPRFRINKLTDEMDQDMRRRYLRRIFLLLLRELGPPPSVLAIDEQSQLSNNEDQ